MSLPFVGLRDSFFLCFFCSPLLSFSFAEFPFATGKSASLPPYACTLRVSVKAHTAHSRVIDTPVCACSLPMMCVVTLCRLHLLSSPRHCSSSPSLWIDSTAEKTKGKQDEVNTPTSEYNKRDVSKGGSLSIGSYHHHRLIVLSPATAHASLRGSISHRLIAADSNHSEQTKQQNGAERQSEKRSIREYGIIWFL